MARVHRWRSTQKRRKKMGSSVAYKTRGTFVSQKMGPPHEGCIGKGGRGGSWGGGGPTKASRDGALYS